VAALERRLASLTLPAPLRRALSATVAEMRDADPAATAVALAQLVAPARETLGSDAGDAIAQAARVARTSAP
jgi:phytoene/squalene synthetase